MVKGTSRHLVQLQGTLGDFLYQVAGAAAQPRSDLSVREGASGDGQAAGKSAEGTGSLRWGSTTPECVVRVCAGVRAWVRKYTCDNACTHEMCGVCPVGMHVCSCVSVGASVRTCVHACGGTTLCAQSWADLFESFWVHRQAGVSILRIPAPGTLVGQGGGVRAEKQLGFLLPRGRG